ncbi:hypothetical protein GLOIN_2v1619159 [Rhizophagus irregularis DAOM 181602=DAOM 197198]|uniref:Protein kinase domain-containing protein n=1 Tax=Rhizophagus irregularis (strain DAOM 181602 / DAOM 197198 / MUCL 43194) TaxID=747089 RepID=A0A2P4PXY5_RHIID|nr:hypothetical protein GLOIN_2v1619159 [Rhizophagus irregularis DAOM 181602=DAOM 197198]POG70220.1 hypothetical protein GLOIN_2v1619159 [Rhizophagus irregularis DAOM 181602=DAOM 197198]|eukprot:XP_025177086.1 hypothetical protein GLOIN_2v1619159 [Rhizophagus irregularis DAOM 181602=DAOM 197198]
MWSNDAVKILEELSGALKSIHDKGVIHQDLRCDNILMNDEDIFHFPAISDLGLKSPEKHCKLHYEEFKKDQLVNMAIKDVEMMIQKTLKSI